ncbi:MAG: amino acid ABC transporter substrate-binding protein [Alphaproteobacteria bacterium]
MSKLLLGLASAAVAIGFAGQAAAATLDVVKQRGELVCGANGARAGFSLVDSQGKWEGLDADTCRAIAAAVLGNPDKVKFLKTTTTTRFPVLVSGEADVLASNVTLTLTRDTAQGLDFGPTTFYDAQGFMVPKKLNVKSVKDLDGAAVCVAPGSTSEKTVADVFRKNNMKYTAVVIEKQQELSQAFFSGRCDVNVQTTSGLASQRAIFAKDPGDWVILPEIFQKDPMGPVIRHGDNQWRDIVTWVVYALIAAEEFGITSKNVDEMKKDEDPQVKRLLGVTPGLGKALGLDEAWAYRAIKAVGNFGEVYDRSFGAGSALKLPRKLNALWTEGGLLYAPPFN